MSGLNELYQQVIVDHNKKPRNFHALDNPSHEAEGFNPLCGDHFTVYLSVDKNDIIQAVSFTGQGCAISTASASLMTEALTGKTIAEADQLFHRFHDVVTKDESTETESLGKLAILIGVKEFPARVKCATLACTFCHLVRVAPSSE